MGKRDSGVSSVIGEMLMIALVLILVPVVTISLMNQLPEDRTPTVTIIGKTDSDGITFYHKGGDYIRIENLKVIIRSDAGTDNIKETEYASRDLIIYNQKNAEVSTFDLGNRIYVDLSRKTLNQESLKDARVVAKNSIIFQYPINT